MRDDEKSELEEPELNITDNTRESEPAPDTEPESEPLTPAAEGESEPPTPVSAPIADTKDAPKTPMREKLVAFLKTKKGKIVAVVVGVLLVLGILLAIPFTRYSMLGAVIKKDVTLTILDSVSKKPISGATVRLATYTATSDAKGVAKVTGVPVGEYTVKIEKKYYTATSSSYTVPILSAPADSRPQLKATGRAVTINVLNKITGACIHGATVAVSGSSTTASETCDVELTLPVQKAAQRGTVKADGYNDATFEIVVTDAENQNVPTALTPSGTLYFLSKRTGKIDVMKSNLDGTEVETVVAGTGQESDTSTVLLSTTDWKYLALQATRDSEKPKLYLIDTATSKLSVMDEGNVDFQLIGWSGHQFVYQVTRSQDIWKDKRQALKSFNAESSKLTTLDETQGGGSSYYDYASQSLANQYIVDGKVVYTKSWDLAQYLTPGDRNSSIMTVDVGGGNKKSLKDFPVANYAYFEGKLYEPGEVYFRAVARADSKASYFEYEDGKVTATADTNDQKFYNSFYATYLISPSGTKTLWYESRDGKKVIFVGDKSANNGREVGVSDYVPYGWHSDDYLLFSKGGSELYILSSDVALDADHKPLKVTDYHKPELNYPGYGSGYGGQ